MPEKLSRLFFYARLFSYLREWVRCPLAFSSASEQERKQEERTGASKPVHDI